MEFKPTSSQLIFYTKSSVLDSSIWNQSLIQVFPKIYTFEQLNDAYNCLRRDHEALRVKFKETADGLVSYVEDYEYMKIPCIKVGSDEELLEEARKFVNLPMDFHGILVNPVIFHTPTKSGIMISAHHIAVDGYCSYVLSEDINKYLQNPEYRAVTQPYAEHMEREEKHKQSKRFLFDREFWKKQFSTNPTCNIFSGQKANIDFSSVDFNKEIPVELVTKVRAFCADNEISPTSFFNTVYAAYIRRMYDVENFTIGVPVLNRTTQTELNTIGLYMHIVPLVINIQPESFIENAKRIDDSWLDIFRHQKFTQHDIRQMLHEEGVPVNTLYDVAADFLEFVPNDDYEIIIPYGNNLTVPMELHLQSFSQEKCTFRICYQKAYFTENEIQIMFDSIISLMENAIEHPFENIHSIEMISAEEKQKLFCEFNDTASDYAKDKCIHELFEEQVEKTPDKVAVVAMDKKLTYRELNEEANRIAHSLIEKGIGRGDIVGLMLPRKSYLLSALFGILKTGAAYLPIDSELPSERIEYMCKDTKAHLVVSDENIHSLLQSDDISNPYVEMTNDALCYCIYTSGSTGQPKGVMAKHRNVVNYISKNEHNIAGKVITEDFEAIVSISTCSFDIFITETVLPLVNGFRTILADEQQCRNQYALNKLLSNEKGEFLQTTPTKFKVLTAEPSQRDFLQNLKAIMLGGEAMEASYLKELKKITKAKIYNIYGTTEVPIWSSFVDTDTFTETITIGKGIANTQIHILDKYLNPVPVGVTGELCIAGDSVAAGYLNRPDLTAEKFIDNPLGEGKMYRTGDNAYRLEDGNIVYVGRSDFQVKIRGLRIELGEIESALQTVEEIDRAVVVVRKDKEDRQLICAFYTGKEKSVKEIKEEIGKTLPKYMIPHIFTRLEKMPMTASGKANRNALPEIDLENISSQTEYVAPETEREILLTDCICDVLGKDKVSVLHNFFDVGGDSLKAIELTAKLENKGYTVAIKTIFSSKDIRELAEKLAGKELEENKTEYGSVIPATAAQMRVYTAQMLKPDSTMYNVTFAFRTKELDKVQLEKAVNRLIERHESLRTHLENRDGEIVQVIEEKVRIKVESTEDINSFVKPFDLGKAPLVRVGCNRDEVVISLHHITVDGESMPVFFRELNDLYMERELSDPLQYGEFAVTDGYTEKNEKYWLDMFADEAPELNLPTDYSRGPQQSFQGSNLYEYIDIKLHKRIEEKSKERGITPYVYYMACFSILLSKLSGNEDIVVGTPISGRQSRYLSTVGMFVNTIALRNKPEGNKTIAELLSEIRDSSVEAIDNQNYPFGELVKKLNINTAGRNPIFDVMLAYQSFEMTDITFADKKAELIPLTTESSKCDMNFSILPRKDDVVLAIEYCTELFREERVRDFAEKYVNILEQCLDDEKYIKDISVTDMKLIDSFNDTASDYAKDKCIHELFEEQVEKTPDKVAVVATDKKLTYRELNEEANRIAHSLTEKGIGRGDIVGLLLPRKSYFLSALFGVLKTGAAYLPIDPDHPQDRIEYMLSDSGAKLCISEDNFSDLLKNQNSENLKRAANSEDICYCIYTSGSTGKSKGVLIYHRNLIWYMSVLKSIYGTENINMPFFTSQCVDLTVPSFYFPLLTGGTAYLYNGELKDDLAKIFNNENLTALKFTPTHMSIICNLVPSKECPNIRYIIVGGETLYKESCFEFLNKFGNHIEIHNEYGPTETTVSCTDYVFTLDEKEKGLYLPIGKPIANTQIYIADKYMKPVPLGVTGELCVAGDGVGAGYLNNTELTAEKFIDNPFGEGKLYRTGDLAYWREDGNIVFVGRKDYQVKIRGLRIELGEIESALQSVSGVDRAVVVVRADKQDSPLICAFYTGEKKSAKELREESGRNLPKYMIPHIFTHLEEMPMTASGKVNRNALPEIELENIGTETEYAAPETAEEKTLADAVCSVLKMDSINMLENFFNIGGDSIKAIYVVSELEEMGYELHVADIMQKDTLSDVAKAMKSISDRIIYDQNETNGFVPFTPIMRAFLKENNTIPKDYVHTCVVSADCDEHTAKKALDALISHHDILRGSFCDGGIEIHPSDEREIYSYESVSIYDTNEAKEYLNGINISDDKLVNVVFCSTEKGNLISITIHHFLIDLISWEIFIKDFQTVVNQIKNNEEISLPAKTASFMLWNDELRKYSETISEESKEYWKNTNKKLDNIKSVNSHTENENEAEEYSFTLDNNISDKLVNEVNKTYGTRINEVLLTALGLAAGRIAGGAVGIIVESHGRAELNKPIAIERTVGWFTSCYPVIIDNNNAVDALINTKETLRRIPKNGVDYLLLNRVFHKNIDIKFNFYKKNSANEVGENKLIAFNFDTSVFPGKINVNCFITDGILTVNISVPKCRHKKQISEELGIEFVNQIEKLVDICTNSDEVVKTRSDFSDDELTEIELEELKDLFDWTDVNEQ